MKKIFRKTFTVIVLLSGLALAAPVARAQTEDAESPEAVVRGFYGWYLGRLNREDWQPLKRRGEALKYLTPQFHRAAPRVIAQQGADIFICAQDWQREWGDDLTFSAEPPRGTHAFVTASFKYGGVDYTKVRLTLLRVGRAWKINSAACGD